MMSLDDAWGWYRETHRSLRRFQRLGRKYWDAAPWPEAMGRDDQLRDVTADDIARGTRLGLDHLDDVAVILLFSAFEAAVREHLAERMAVQAELLTDPILAAAAKDAIRGVGEGSFYRRVLEPLKSERVIDPALVTEVDQVRDYRNWAAHGRRKSPVNVIDPRTAYDRLRRFLTAVGMA